MLYVRSLLVAGLSVSAFVACSSTPGGSPTETPEEAGTPRADGGSDGEAPLVTPPGQVSIRVDQARMTSSSALQLSVTVGIGVGGGALPLDPNFFSLKTDDGVLHSKPTSSAQTWWVDGTSPSSTAKLLPGESFKNWRLTFSDVTYGGAAPTELIIKAPSGDVNKPILTATASVSLEKCSSCGAGKCTYLDRDPQNCGECGTRQDPSDPTKTMCKNGQFQCSTGLSSCTTQPASYPGERWVTCVDLQSSNVHCGSCGRANRDPSNAVCQGGQIVCRNSARTECNGLCVDLQTDLNNCGSCGNVVASRARCTAGTPTCIYSEQSICGDECVNLLYDNNNCGACGVQVPQGTTCSGGNLACAYTDETVCSMACVKLKTDVKNCGTCGKVCGSGASCLNGNCAITAQSPWRTGTSCRAVCRQAGLSCSGPSDVELASIAYARNSTADCDVDLANATWNFGDGSTYRAVKAYCRCQ